MDVVVHASGGAAAAAAAAPFEAPLAGEQYRKLPTADGAGETGWDHLRHGAVGAAAEIGGQTVEGVSPDESIPDLRAKSLRACLSDSCGHALELEEG